jgi:hypothetical protein
MKKRALVELLDAYADDLLAGRLAAADYLSYAAQSNLAAELFKLTDEIVTLLVPVNPSPEFIQQLGTTLAAAATPAEIHVARPSRRKIWLGALVSGSLVSAVGVLALWWMKRGRGGTVAAG